MGNLASIARPYALAAFEFARDHNALDDWKAFLHNVASMAQDKNVFQLIKNPQITSAQLQSLFINVWEGKLNLHQTNFLSLIALHKRFMFLPEISSLFDTYYANLEKLSAVKVVTAVKPDAAFEAKLAQALTKRTQRKVTIKSEVDPSLLGGAIIHIGDRVIDGSIRGKLNRLLQELTD